MSAADHLLSGIDYSSPMQPRSRRRDRSPLGLFGSLGLRCVGVTLLLLGVLAPACSPGDTPRTITVAAASSLTGAFEAARVRFEAENPGTTVNLSFGSSSSLAQQILDGSPIDVFASADNETMARVAGLVAGRASTFTTNTLEILVARGNPLGVGAVADLARPDLVTVTCGPEVPIGRYSMEVLERAGVALTPSSFEADVRGIVTKVISGEADAGIVYTTDVRSAGDRATGVSIPMKQNILASYPIALMERGRSNATAAAWVEFIKSSEGQRILTEFGFIAP